MGGKFGSINVKSGELASVSVIPGAVVREIVSGWITVAHDDFAWGTTHKIAQRLSKDIGQTVLSTEYFDDDYVEFVLYREGKRVAIHIPAEYEDFPRKQGKSESFAESLSMSPDDEKLLRQVFAETDPETAVLLMESLLDCPINICAETLDEAAPPSRDYLKSYIKRKQESKIKNQTKLILCDEKEINFAFRLDPTYPIVCNVHKDKLRPDQKPQGAWGVDDEGKLRCLFEMEIPDYVSNYYCLAHKYGVSVFLFKDNNQDASWLYIFAEDGTVLDIIDIHQDIFVCKIIDNCRIFVNDECYNFREHKSETLAEHPCEIKVKYAEIIPADFLTAFEADGRLYFEDNRSRILSYDLARHETTIMKQPKQGYRRLFAILPGIGPVCYSKGYIEVADENLQIISLHKVKGSVKKFLSQDGRYFIVTYIQEKARFRWVDYQAGEFINEVIKPSHIYVYELKR